MPSSIRTSQVESIEIPHGSKLRFSVVEAIDWIEADGDYVRLHTGGTSHLLRSTLSAVEAELDPFKFVRIHRSTVVRICRILEMEPYFRGEYIVALSTGARLKMSRSYRERLRVPSDRCCDSGRSHDHASGGGTPPPG